MNINLARIPLLREQQAVIESQILSYKKYEYRTTHTDADQQIARLNERWQDIQVLIDEARSAGEGSPATPDKYGTVKYDGITIQKNTDNQLFTDHSIYDATQDVAIATAQSTADGAVTVNTAQDAAIATAQSTADGAVTVNTAQGAAIATAQSTADGAVTVNTAQDSAIAALQAQDGVQDNLIESLKIENFTVNTPADLLTIPNVAINDRAKVLQSKDNGDGTFSEEIYLLWEYPSNLASSWENITSLGSTAEAPVISVNGKTGAVSIVLGDIPDALARVVAVENKNSTQDTAIAAAQTTANGAVTKNTQQDTAIAAAQTTANGAVTKNTQQDTAIATAQTTANNAVTKNIEQDTRISSLENRPSSSYRAKIFAPTGSVADFKTENCTFTVVSTGSIYVKLDVPYTDAQEVTFAASPGMGAAQSLEIGVNFLPNDTRGQFWIVLEGETGTRANGQFCVVFF